jgi:hypothetical protein
MSKYFVWISGLRGPEPQIWDEKNKTSEGKPIATLFKRELHPDEHTLGLNYLSERYPCEAKS